MRGGSIQGALSHYLKHHWSDWSTLFSPASRLFGSQRGPLAAVEKRISDDPKVQVLPDGPRCK